MIAMTRRRGAGIESFFIIRMAPIEKARMIKMRILVESMGITSFRELGLDLSEIRHHVIPLFQVIYILRFGEAVINPVHECRTT